MFLFEFLKVPELALGMWAGNAVTQGLIGMQEDFFQAAAQAHVFVPGEIVEKASKTFFQTHWNVNALNFYHRAGVEDGVPKAKIITMEIANGIVTQSILAVSDRLGDFNAVCLMEFKELVGIANHEIGRAARGAGRALLQENPYAIETYAGKGGRIAPGKAQFEAELGGIEINRRRNISDGKAGVVLFTVHLRDDEGCHGSLSFILAASQIRFVTAIYLALPWSPEVERRLLLFRHDLQLV
jgi:hypothetical protein